MHPASPRGASAIVTIARRGAVATPRRSMCRVHAGAISHDEAADDDAGAMPAQTARSRRNRLCARRQGRDLLWRPRFVSPPYRRPLRMGRPAGGPVRGLSRQKPLRAERRGLPVSVVSNSCAFHLCARGRGCIGHPAFRTPSHFGGRDCSIPRTRKRRETAEAWATSKRSRVGDEQEFAPGATNKSSRVGDEQEFAPGCLTFESEATQRLSTCKAVIPAECALAHGRGEPVFQSIHDASTGSALACAQRKGAGAFGGDDGGVR